MRPRIELVWLSETAPAVRWTHGMISRAAPTPWAVGRLLKRRLEASDADGFLFWDPALGAPGPRQVAAAFQSRGDLWHAGLRQAMGGKPGLLDFAAPDWPLGCDPAPEIEATSWRLSLRACLVRTQVLRALGGPDSRFDSLELAGLEMGYRYIRFGAIPRHVPSLIRDGAPALGSEGTLADELRFVSLAHGKFWARWALGRAFLAGYVSARDVLRCGRTLRQLPAPQPIEPLKMAPAAADISGGLPRVSVILPTLDRYPYLFRLLDQLRRQSVPASEIIIVDQTPKFRRDSIASAFPDLPVRVLVRDLAGQCAARNAAIAAARGDYLLFLDDDDEVPNGLIEQHLRCLRETGADACCGVADEVGAGALPHGFSFFRASDIFSTNNAMLRRTALRQCGLFDLAYDRGGSDDGDLGMRLVLCGALLVLNPAIRVLHHHAPRGGLRAHGARVVTYAMSRQSIWKRRLPAASEIYYLHRYFTPRQRREALWHSALGTFAVRGNVWKKLAKALIAALQLPSTLLRIRAARIQAEALARSFPAIPSLPDDRDQRLPEAPRPQEVVSRAVSV